jgi:hypothetical protein
MSKHTPGPWIVRRMENDCFVEGIWEDIDGKYKTEILSGELYPSKLADAYLVAQAPAMYDMLKLMTALVKLKYGNLDPDIWEKIVEAEKIITQVKAEG